MKKGTSYLAGIIGITKSTSAFLISFCLCICMSGCALPKPRPVKQSGLEKINPSAMIKAEERLRAPGPPPFSEKMVPITDDLTEDTRLYSFVFDNAPLGDVLNAITNNTELNLSVASDIDLSVPITVRLKNATFKESLDMIVVNAAGYAWKISSGCLYIKRFEEKIYHLDYLNLKSETNVAVGGDMLASGVDNSGVTGKYEVRTGKEKENSDIWSSVQKTLEGLKSKDGILQINRNTGIIYMADVPGKIKSMVRFLNSLSEELHRQVIIDARIFEVSLSDTSKYGIDWSTMEIAFKSRSNLLPDHLRLNFNNGSILLAGESSLFAAIDFLRTQGDITVLSNPHLSVTNGQSAVLTVGYQFPYGDINGVDRDTETGLITYGSSIKRAVLGLQLGITPQISRNGVITLHIVPTITRIQREEKVDIPVAANEVQTISNPVIDLQELFTTVRVREGQTLVLAGLISQTKDMKHEGLPLLESIPLLGQLFKHVEETEKSKELVIFITPHIREAI